MIDINHWRRLTYYDPARILRDLRKAERELAEVEMPPDVRRLRTKELKKYREWRDAALFTYGIGLAQGTPIGYATEEARDYDFVTAWQSEDTQHFCPVQLKELVPADLNPTATIQELLSGLSKYAGTTATVLAVKLNRRSTLDLSKLVFPKCGFAELWFFWGAAPDASKWVLYGDALATPGRFEFAYPS